VEQAQSNGRRPLLTGAAAGIFVTAVPSVMVAASAGGVIAAGNTAFATPGAKRPSARVGQMSDDVRFVPDDFVVPRELITDAFRLEPLGPEHNESDYQAWMSSIDHIRATPGLQDWSWPRPEMTIDDNLKDLEEHSSDFKNRKGFTYTVLASDSGEVVGCVYIYPSKSGAGARVRSWVSADRAELDAPLHDAVSQWLRASWPFTEVTYAPR